MGNVVIVRESGKLIPRAYLEKVLASNPSQAGFAVLNDGAFDFDQSRFSDDNPPLTTEELEGWQEQYKDKSSVSCFGQYTDMADTDVQPYEVLVDEKSEPTMFAFLAGDFSSYAQPEAAFTDEFFAANKFLIPLIKKWYANQGQDLAKLYNELNDPMNKTIIENTVTTNGAITLLVKGFPPLTFDKSSGGSQFPWGWVSDTFGYTETPSAPPQEEKPTVVQRVVSGFRTRRPTVVDKPPESAKTDTAVPATKVDPPKDDKNKEGPVKPVETETETEHEMVSCPPEIHGNERKKWFKNNCVMVPKNWWEASAKAPKKKPIKSLQDIKPTAEQTAITYTRTEVPGPSKPAEAILMIDKNNIRKVQEYVQTLVTLDRNGRSQDLDIKQLQAVETKHPTLFEQIGEQDDTIYDNRPDEFFLALGKLDINALALLCRHYRFKYLMAQHDVENLLDDKSDTSGSGVVAQPEKKIVSGFRRHK